MSSSIRRNYLPQFVLAFLIASSASGFAQYVVTCASEDGGRHYCAADTSSGVSMQRQHSKSACTQNQTWGFDQGGIWVTRGCRADFIVNAKQVASTRGGDRDRDMDRDRDRNHDHDADHDRDYDHYSEANRNWDSYRDNDYDRDRGRSPRRDQTLQLTCASEDGGRHYCESDLKGTAKMLRQRSGSPCREGYSWGNDRRGIWVDHGCRADFELTGRVSRSAFYGGNPNYIGTLNCSSDFGTRQLCPVETRAGVRLVRQISASACRMGYSWGYDRDGVWVDHGCRGEFEIGFRR